MSTDPEHKKRVAGGAGFAFLGRMGALIEGASVIAFTWLYGPVTFGLFAVLWSYVKVMTAISEAAMTTTLQRFVPKADKDEANMVAGHALKLGLLVSSLFAIAGTIAAPYLTNFINAGEADAERLTTVIRIYVWVLPFWTTVEIGTAAIRARRTFGPEIKVRIFYEQGLRLVSAVIFAMTGLLTYGLFLAHLVSVFLAAVLALRLVAKNYDMGAVLRAPMFGPLAKEMRSYGFSLMPANLIKRLTAEFPVMYLNFLLPGAAGAAAGGYYQVARKVASAVQAIRLTFEYVMAPLAAEKEGTGDRQALEDMFAYATRLSVSIALPFGAALILARNDILATMQPEFAAATAAIAILVAGRIFEAATGPSSAIIEMLGHKLLPTVNSIAGLLGMLGIGLWLIPEYKVTGAAIAAASGLNITAILSLIQSRVLFGLFPYTSAAIRPILTSAVLAGGIMALVPSSFSWAPPIGITMSAAVLITAILLVIRYGLNDADAEALGKFAVKIRPKPKS